MACDRTAPDDSSVEAAATGPKSRFEPAQGSRFRTEPEVPATPSHRFRDFDVELEPPDAPAETVEPEAQPAPEVPEVEAQAEVDPTESLYDEPEPEPAPETDDVTGTTWPDVERRTSGDRRSGTERRGPAQPAASGPGPSSPSNAPVPPAPGVPPGGDESDEFPVSGPDDSGGDSAPGGPANGYDDQNEWEKIADLFQQDSVGFDHPHPEVANSGNNAGAETFDQPTQAIQGLGVSPQDRLNSALSRIQTNTGVEPAAPHDAGNVPTPMSANEQAWWDSDPELDEWGSIDETYDEVGTDQDWQDGNPGQELGWDWDSAASTAAGPTPALPQRHSQPVPGNSDVDQYDDFDDDLDANAYADFGAGHHSGPSASPSAQRSASTARFADDVDLDEPDEFEVGDEWAFDDEFDEPVAAPRNGTRPRPASRKPATQKRPRNDSDLAPFGQAKAKMIVVAAILIAIVMLSAAGSDIVNRVGAQSTSGHGASVGCANEEAIASQGATLQTKLAQPGGWEPLSDQAAGTGVIDVAKALAVEPDQANALSNLDQARFSSGYDRHFENQSDERLQVALYEFPGSACASDYSSTRSGFSGEAVVEKFDVAGVPGAEGLYVAGPDEVGTYEVVARAENLVVIMTLRSEESQEQAIDLLSRALAQQLAAVESA